MADLNQLTQKYQPVLTAIENVGGRLDGIAAFEIGRHPAALKSVVVAADVEVLDGLREIALDAWMPPSPISSTRSLWTRR